MVVDVKTRISQTRARLLLDHPWFGSLAMRLHMEADEKQPTVYTDGTILTYNTKFVQGLNDKELTTVVAHEVMHCALRHMFRAGGREMKTWNDACDYVVNSLLKDNGFQLPAGALEDTSKDYKDMSAEQVYAKLIAEKPPGGGNGPSKWDKPNPTGSFGQGRPPSSDQPQEKKKDKDKGGDKKKDKNKGDGQGDPTDGDGDGDQDDQDGDQPGSPRPDGLPPMSESDWEIAAEQASAVAKKAGKLPAGADRTLAASRKPPANWREILRRFLQQSTPSDYSWAHPNRRHIWQGLYLPGQKRENMPKFMVAIDTSGSIDQVLLSLFAKELTGILHECRPDEIEVVYCDAQVHKPTQIFYPDDAELELKPKGGGGTAFQPVFDYIAKMEEKPAACIYFTDLYGDKPIQPEEYPVLWVVPEQYSNMNPPWGEKVVISQYEE